MWSEFAAACAASPPLFAGLSLVLGLLVGSFLNVVIHRLPLMLERDWRAQAAEVLQPSAAAGGAAPSNAPARPEPRFDLFTPPSACPKCHTPIKPWHNVPVLGWLVLRGRCAACGAPISPRYPAIELASGLASAAVAWHFGFGAVAACALLVTWALIALTGIDIDHQLLPDSITLPLLWTGLLAAALVGPVAGQALPVAPAMAILGASAGYVSLWLVFQTFRLLTGKEGMGYGDFKLFAALGAWLGWRLLPLVLVLAAAAGAVLGIAMIVFRGRDRAAPIPFGPYLAIAGWLAMLYGHDLIGAYLRLSGLDR
ncbi:MAG: prepilin peptidase [Gammaproteobacteria bacterium]|nr:prepilin peptidase [Gammaproteobacteria bacterium]